MRSSGDSTAILYVFIFLLLTLVPFLIRRMLNPLENAASRLYADKINEREADKIYYVANGFRDVQGLSPELKAAIALVPNREPQPGDREKYGKGTHATPPQPRATKPSVNKVTSTPAQKANNTPKAIKVTCPACGARVQAGVRRCPACNSHIPRFAVQPTSATKGSVNVAASAQPKHGPSHAKHSAENKRATPPTATTSQPTRHVTRKSSGSSTTPPYCYYCAAPLKKGSLFCPRCGNPVHVNDHPSQTETPRYERSQTVAEPKASPAAYDYTSNGNINSSPIPPPRQSSLQITFLTVSLTAIAVALVTFAIVMFMHGPAAPIPNGGGQTITSPATNTTQEQTNQAVSPEPTAPAPVTRYKIAMDPTYRPFEYLDEAGILRGVDVDLLEAIGACQNFSYDIQQLSFDSCMAGVKSGDCDAMISGVSITEDRKEYFDFSDPYYTNTVDTDSFDYAFVVKKGENADLLAKFNVGLATIKENGIYDSIIQKYSAELEPQPTPAVSPYELYVEDENTFVAGGLRFTIPEYWRGKVTLTKGIDEIMVTSNDLPPGSLFVVYITLPNKCPLAEWDDIVRESTERYALPDGSEALGYKDVKSAMVVGGGRASCTYKASDDVYVHIACGAGDGTTDVSVINDLRSLGAGPEVSAEFYEDGRFKPFVELWGSATRA